MLDNIDDNIFTYIITETEETTDKNDEEEIKKLKKELKKKRILKGLKYGAIAAGSLYGAYKLDKNIKDNSLAKNRQAQTDIEKDVLDRSTRYEEMRVKENRKRNKARHKLKNEYDSNIRKIKNKFPGIVNIGKDIKEEVLYGKTPKYAHVTKSKQREFIQKEKNNAKKALDKIDDTYNRNINKINAHQAAYNTVKKNELERLQKTENELMNNKFGAGLIIGSKSTLRNAKELGSNINNRANLLVDKLNKNNR